MAGISVSGIGSGLDINQLVSDLVSAEAAAPTARLNRREASLQGELSAIGALKGALSSFQTVVKDLKSATALAGVKATVGDESLLGASATSIAQPGSYEIEVLALAKAQKLASGGFQELTDVVGSGTLTFRYGDYDADSNTFTENPDKTAQTLTLDTSNNTLAGLRDAINEADLGVRANIINDGSSYRLVLASQDSGAANGLEITVADADGNHTDASGLSQLAFDPTAAVGAGKNLTQTVAAQDASLLVDGLAVTGETNTLVGVVQGVTLNLKQAEPGTVTTLTVDRDAEAISGKVKGFVDAFNSLLATIQALTKFDPETGEKGLLLGDAGVRGVQNQLRNVITGLVEGASESFGSLTDIGISTQRDGTLALDSTKLSAAVDADPDGVAGLFARVGRADDALIDYVSSAPGSTPGDYAVEITQFASQGSLTGGAFSALAILGPTVDADNDTLELKVDGVQSGVITLTQGAYADGDALALEIQTRINEDSALQDAEVSVSVAFDADNDRLVLTSDSYGSASTVEITALDTDSGADFGLAVAAGVAGQDVAGNIGGEAATGEGNRLTGTGVAEGIIIEVLGGVIGDRGTVSLSDGVSLRLDTILGSYLETGGVLGSRTESLTRRIDRLDDQRETLSRRLETLETRLRSQFQALDTLLGEMTATGDFLAQQLAGMADIYSSDS